MLHSRSSMAIVLAVSSLATCLSSGCQTTIGGQTLPSAYYLRDDVQYFPAGQETQLPNARKAIEDYNASNATLADDLSATQP